MNKKEQMFALVEQWSESGQQMKRVELLMLPEASILVKWIRKSGMNLVEYLRVKSSKTHIVYSFLEYIRAWQTSKKQCIFHLPLYRIHEVPFRWVFIYPHPRLNAGYNWEPSCYGHSMRFTVCMFFGNL